MKNKRSLMILVTGVLFVTEVFFTGCGGGGGGTTTDNDSTPPAERNTGAVNKAPTVNSGEDKTVTINEAVTLVGTATDSDGTISSVEWKKGSEVLSTTLSFSYTPTRVGTDVLTLVALDDDGKSASDEMNVVVEEDNPFDDVKR